MAMVICFAVSAGNVTLPDGRVLENAFVMSERPDGLEIGHKNGVIFVNFTDLPKDIQKKYNYSLEKAAQYQADVAGFKEQRAKELASRKVEQAKAFEEQQKRTAEMEFDKLGIEIQQYQNRIANLKAEIPRLEQNYSSLLNKSSQMMIDNAVMNQTSTGGNFCWNGGFLTTGGGQTARKKEAIKQITDEAAETKETLDSDKKELQQKEDKLVVMKNSYEKMKAQRKQ
ncbi:MAG TPA: hypothetical protein DCZ94_16750 [Lentisphaeria bacterium]|nr:hypothetical protein [Lentisphaeria bacterium]